MVEQLTREALIKISADVTGAESGVTRLTKGVMGLDKALTSVNNTSGMLGKQLVTALAKASAILPGGSLKEDFYRAASNQSLYNPAQAAGIARGRGASADSITKETQKLRTKYGISAAEAGALATESARFGLLNAEAKPRMTAAVKMSAVTGEDATGILNSLTRLQRVMGEGSRYSEGFAESLTQLSGKMSVSTQSMMDFATSLTPIAQMAGVSNKETLAVSAAFNRVGEGGGIGEGVAARVMDRISTYRRSGRGGNDLAMAAGMDLKDLDNASSMDIFRGIVKNAGDGSPEGYAKLERLNLEGPQTVHALRRLNNLNALEDSLNAANSSDKSSKLDEAFKKTQGTYEASVNRRTAAIDVIKEDAGKPLLGAATVWNDAITGMARALSPAISALGQFTGAVTGVVGVVAKVAAPLAVPLAVTRLADTALSSGAVTGFMSGVFKNPTGRFARELNEDKKGFSEGERFGHWLNNVLPGGSGHKGHIPGVDGERSNAAHGKLSGYFHSKFDKALKLTSISGEHKTVQAAMQQFSDETGLGKHLSEKQRAHFERRGKSLAAGSPLRTSDRIAVTRASVKAVTGAGEDAVTGPIKSIAQGAKTVKGGATDILKTAGGGRNEKDTTSKPFGSLSSDPMKNMSKGIAKVVDLLSSMAEKLGVTVTALGDFESAVEEAEGSTKKSDAVEEVLDKHGNSQMNSAVDTAESLISKFGGAVPVGLGTAVKAIGAIGTFAYSQYKKHEATVKEAQERAAKWSLGDAWGDADIMRDKGGNISAGGDLRKQVAEELKGRKFDDRFQPLSQAERELYLDPSYDTPTYAKRILGSVDTNSFTGDLIAAKMLGATPEVISNIAAGNIQAGLSSGYVNDVMSSDLSDFSIFGSVNNKGNKDLETAKADQAVSTMNSIFAAGDLEQRGQLLNYLQTQKIDKFGRSGSQEEALRAAENLLFGNDEKTRDAVTDRIKKAYETGTVKVDGRSIEERVLSPEEFAANYSVTGTGSKLRVFDGDGNLVRTGKETKEEREDRFDLTKDEIAADYELHWNIDGSRYVTDGRGKRVREMSTDIDGTGGIITYADNDLTKARTLDFTDEISASVQEALNRGLLTDPTTVLDELAKAVGGMGVLSDISGLSVRDLKSQKSAYISGMAQFIADPTKDYSDFTNVLADRRYNRDKNEAVAATEVGKNWLYRDIDDQGRMSSGHGGLLDPRKDTVAAIASDAILESWTKALNTGGALPELVTQAVMTNLTQAGQHTVGAADFSRVNSEYLEITGTKGLSSEDKQLAAKALESSHALEKLAVAAQGASAVLLSTGRMSGETLTAAMDLLRDSPADGDTLASAQQAYSDTISSSTAIKQQAMSLQFAHSDKEYQKGLTIRDQNRLNSWDNPNSRARRDAALQYSYDWSDYQKSVTRTKEDNALQKRYADEDFSHNLALRNRDIAQGWQQTGEQRALEVSQQAEQRQQQRKFMAEDKEYSEFQARRQLGWTQERADRDFNISLERDAEDYGKQLSRAFEDFDKSRQRSERDFNLQQARGAEDFYKSQRRGLDDFNKSRLRSEEDFNLQKTRMAEDQALKMGNFYERVQAQQKKSASTLNRNAEKQIDRFEKQLEDLQKLRGMGLSSDAIKQLDLTNPEKAQQVSRLVRNFEKDPSQLERLNTNSAKMKEIGKAFVEDEDNTQFSRMNEDFQKQQARSYEDFNLNTARAFEDFSTQSARAWEDFSRQAKDAAEDFNLSMRRMEEDHSQSLRYMYEDKAKADSDRLEDFERMLLQQEESYKRSLDRMAEQEALADKQRQEGWELQDKWRLIQEQQTLDEMLYQKKVSDDRRIEQEQITLGRMEKDFNESQERIRQAHWQAWEDMKADREISFNDMDVQYERMVNQGLAKYEELREDIRNNPLLQPFIDQIEDLDAKVEAAQPFLSTITGLQEIAREAGVAQEFLEKLVSLLDIEGAQHYIELMNSSVDLPIQFMPGANPTIDMGFKATGGVLQFTSGGVLPGYTPGTDVHTFTSPTAGTLMLSGGEAIMRPEWVKAIGGPSEVNRLNAAAIGGQIDAVSKNQTLATGGIAKFATGGVLRFAGGGLLPSLGQASAAMIVIPVQAQGVTQAAGEMQQAFETAGTAMGRAMEDAAKATERAWDKAIKEIVKDSGQLSKLQTEVDKVLKGLKTSWTTYKDFVVGNSGIAASIVKGVKEAYSAMPSDLEIKVKEKKTIWDNYKTFVGTSTTGKMGEVTTNVKSTHTAWVDNLREVTVPAKITQWARYRDDIGQYNYTSTKLGQMYYNVTTFNENTKLDTNTKLNRIKDYWNSLGSGIKTISEGASDNVVKSNDKMEEAWIETASQAIKGIGKVSEALTALASFMNKFATDPDYTTTATATAGTVATSSINGSAGSVPSLKKSSGYTGGPFTASNIAAAGGGVLPGYTPGTDVHMFESPTGGKIWLSGGEAIMRPEFVTAVGGPESISKINQAAKNGLFKAADIGVDVMATPPTGYPGGVIQRSADSFASGGVVRDPQGMTDVKAFAMGGVFNPAEISPSVIYTIPPVALPGLGAVTVDQEPKRNCTCPEDNPKSFAGGGIVQTILNYALSKVGAPYVWGAEGPNCFDCSGLVKASYGAAGIALPHQSQAFLSYGQAGNPSNPSPGDIMVWYPGTSGGGATGHAALAMGGGQMVEAGGHAKGVGVGSYRTPNALRHLVDGDFVLSNVPQIGGSFRQIDWTRFDKTLDEKLDEMTKAIEDSQGFLATGLKRFLPSKLKALVSAGGERVKTSLNSSAYSDGGVLPGFSPDMDNYFFENSQGIGLKLAGGEAIMRPEFTYKVGGKAGVEVLNQWAMGGFYPEEVMDKFFTGFHDDLSLSVETVLDSVAKAIRNLLPVKGNEIVRGYTTAPEATYNQQYDSSVKVTGPITVQAQDPNAMARAIEAQARFKRL